MNRIIYVRDSIEQLFTFGFSWLCILYTCLHVLWFPIDNIVKANTFTLWNIGLIILNIVTFYVVITVIMKHLDVK